MDYIEWEQRRPGELTSQYLGRVLDWIGDLGDMPRRAREAHFDDYFCPPEIDDGMNIHRLVYELRSHAQKASEIARLRLTAVIQAAIEGEFDGTAEEAERWRVSAEGQRAMKMLTDQ